uniref:UV excision repair protein RAD23 n=1 Tax=Parascaris univalens TaxID=6257 RepID=A0A915B028_PARUN
MKITFKTISQVTFHVEVDPSITIGQLKAKIAEQEGESEYPIDGQKLIYNGKILDDAQTVEELKIDAAKFIVVMVARKKAPPPATNAPESTPATPAVEEGAASVPSTEAVTAAPTGAAQSVPQQASAAAPDALTPEQEETVQAIVAMGYPRDRVIRALRAAFFNGDRAVEYLCTEIPDEEEIAGQHDEGEAEESAGEESAQGLEFLRQLPQFEQLRELVQSNPAILPQIIQQIAQSNPALMRAIQSNQEQFVNLLNAPSTEGGGQGGAAPGGAPQPHAQPRGIAIEVTAAERDAINRLKAMGFPEQLVIEAYFACDKNEDLAVNYILARMDEVAAELDALEPQGQGGAS